MNQFLISAAHKSSGKTTLSIGLCAALRRRGLSVQPFKKGPDYIDPMWLGLASGRPCHNLDFFLSPDQEIVDTFMQRSHGAEVALAEGNKGLYDGLNLDGSNSNAALAKLLKLPVILVVDARGMTRGVAPLLLGYQAFDRDVQIAGVILNQLGGRRHEKKLRAVIEHYTHIPVIGAVQHDDTMAIVERHLGLMPSNETATAMRKIYAIADAVAQQVDLDQLLALTRTENRPAESIQQSLPIESKDRIKLGIARDAAFGFYYPGDLESLEAHGASLVPFDTLHDTRLPDVDGLFIGGGFPETQMQALEANNTLRTAIRQAIENGLPVYAECGGLMYLSRSLSWNGKTHAMVGAIPADTIMHDRPQGRGYVVLRETGASPWPAGTAPQSNEIHAHEFHYSALTNLAPNLRYAYEVTRGAGVDGQHDGIVIGNLLATYTHMRDVGGNHWTRRFVEFIRTCREQRGRKH
jgi:cobyrinic acid a,c-diamide synthase